ncbi:MULTISPECIES: hypothetical protein [Ensifer]|jgi:hypothetical protein|uniref:Uncharacterized protein n=1 Tax=Ensifer canadensis TaxID=555315 RepID=A0AAW4FK86_9HYPH|nr:MULTISPECIES: hypothetical protein [Ensifer]MDP9631315.1 hypothetical protein [Ensifer adhaerens]KQU95361.1 hypothetical protein ASD00_20635 [Ensifer sp. Root31]KQW39783.1 hypothetical protein ASD02_15550 [Ensifer sp. Root1252]KQW60054.1 hypothetical protein ASD03_15230 [Ensifer sp. Root127]KQY61003.1 hypothetical protein ASD52_20515 [Ensifer sp. Root142]
MSRFPHLAAQAEQRRRSEGSDNYATSNSVVRDAFLGIGIRLGIVLGLAYAIQMVIPWFVG